MSSSAIFEKLNRMRNEELTTTKFSYYKDFDKDMDKLFKDYGIKISKEELELHATEKYGKDLYGQFSSIIDWSTDANLPDGTPTEIDIVWTYNVEAGKVVITSMSVESNKTNENKNKNENEANWNRDLFKLEFWDGAKKDLKAMNKELDIQPPITESDIEKTLKEKFTLKGLFDPVYEERGYDVTVKVSDGRDIRFIMGYGHLEEDIDLPYSGTYISSIRSVWVDERHQFDIDDGKVKYSKGKNKSKVNEVSTNASDIEIVYLETAQTLLNRISYDMDEDYDQIVHDAIDYALGENLLTEGTKSFKVNLDDSSIIDESGVELTLDCEPFDGETLKVKSLTFSNYKPTVTIAENKPVKEAFTDAELDSEEFTILYSNSVVEKLAEVDTLNSDFRSVLPDYLEKQMFQGYIQEDETEFKGNLDTDIESLDFSIEFEPFDGHTLKITELEVNTNKDIKENSMKNENNLKLDDYNSSYDYLEAIGVDSSKYSFTYNPGELTSVISDKAESVVWSFDDDYNTNFEREMEDFGHFTDSLQDKPEIGVTELPFVTEVPGKVTISGTLITKPFDGEVLVIEDIINVKEGSIVNESKPIKEEVPPSTEDFSDDVEDNQSSELDALADELSLDTVLAAVRVYKEALSIHNSEEGLDEDDKKDKIYELFLNSIEEDIVEEPIDLEDLDTEITNEVRKVIRRNKKMLNEANVKVKRDFLKDELHNLISYREFQSILVNKR